MSFDAEVESAAGTVVINEFGALYFGDTDSPSIFLIIWPNVFVPETEEDEELSEAYPPVAAKVNRERLEASLRELERRLSGAISFASSERLQAIDTYGIPEDARSVYA